MHRYLEFTLISKCFRFSGCQVGFLECAKYGLKAPSCSQFIFRKILQGASINSKRFENDSKNSGLGGALTPLFCTWVNTFPFCYIIERVRPIPLLGVCGGGDTAALAKYRHRIEKKGAKPMLYTIYVRTLLIQDHVINESEWLCSRLAVHT